MQGLGFAFGLRSAYIRPAMEAPQFLNVLAIKKIAFRKGCTAERTATIKHRHYVQLFDAKGRVVEGAKRGTGFSLLEAKRTLEVMPDQPVKKERQPRARTESRRRVPRRKSGSS